MKTSFTLRPNTNSSDHSITSFSDQIDPETGEVLLRSKNQSAFFSTKVYLIIATTFGLAMIALALYATVFLTQLQSELIKVREELASHTHILQTNTTNIDSLLENHPVENLDDTVELGDSPSPSDAPEIDISSEYQYIGQYATSNLKVALIKSSKGTLHLKEGDQLTPEWIVQEIAQSHISVQSTFGHVIHISSQPRSNAP